MALEEEVESEGLGDIFAHPLKSARKYWARDLSVLNERLPKRMKGKTLAEIALTIGSFGLWAIPHELIHAGVNKINGVVNEEIAINRFYGGDFWHAIFPDIRAKWMLPFIGGYVKMSEESSNFDRISCAASPYILTPLGIYLMLKSKKEKSLPMAVAGSGLIAMHAGGIIGDFFNIGRLTVDGLTGVVSENGAPSGASPSILALIAGFYVGCKVMGLTYRTMRVGIEEAMKRKYL